MGATRTDSRQATSDSRFSSQQFDQVDAFEAVLCFELWGHFVVGELASNVNACLPLRGHALEQFVRGCVPKRGVVLKDPKFARSHRAARGGAVVVKHLLQRLPE